MIMVEAYNLYLGGYLPKISPKTSVHNKHELKSKYKSIVSLNNANPLVMVRLSNDTQAYALNVKEMSMELAETAENVLNGDPEERQGNMESLTDLYNRLLRRSDEYGEANNKPSRPGGELRNLVDRNEDELVQAGFSVDSRGFLTAPAGGKQEPVVPEKFIRQLLDKCDHMGMNPMEYVDSKIYSYAHLHRSDIGTAYESSIYSGMLFNSYC